MKKGDRGASTRPMRPVARSTGEAGGPDEGKCSRTVRAHLRQLQPRQGVRLDPRGGAEELPGRVEQDAQVVGPNLRNVMIALVRSETKACQELRRRGMGMSCVLIVHLACLGSRLKMSFVSIFL